MTLRSDPAYFRVSPDGRELSVGRRAVVSTTGGFNSFVGFVVSYSVRASIEAVEAHSKGRQGPVRSFVFSSS